MTVASRAAPPVSRADVERLVRFDGRGARVLSVYLDIHPERQVTRSYRIVLEDLARAARDRLDEQARLELDAEVARVQAWLEKEEPPRARGLAIFSSSATDLWETYRLPAPVPDRLSFETHPVIIPLLSLIEDYERYVVALVDKESARLLTVFEGRIESVETFSDDVPAKHDTGGPAQARLQRHHEDHVLRHVKRVVQRLAERLRDAEFDRLILAGPEEATTEVRHHLPHELARRLVATVPAEMFATDDEILRITLEIEQRAERESEDAIVTAVIDASRSNGPGACGMFSTLEAVWLRQVRTLVLADGLSASGSECPVDEGLYPDPPGPCPMCGAETVAVADIVDRAAQLTIEQDGDVEIVHERAAQRLRDACDGMGAVLRFRLHA
ncbi:MAG TPA: Vms1/Ankzf1 family peptidyl-tRNA hydrolase [Candidatus Limnocylindrales bacterium]|nr:Vms1/Ankzf1 family peptidyl-tRNA hydrolase [Candidatus Limnocylindrales bacterium]